MHSLDAEVTIIDAFAVSLFQRKNQICTFSEYSGSVMMYDNLSETRNHSTPNFMREKWINNRTLNSKQWKLIRTYNNWWQRRGRNEKFQQDDQNAMDLLTVCYVLLPGYCLFILVNWLIKEMPKNLAARQLRMDCTERKFHRINPYNLPDCILVHGMTHFGLKFRSANEFSILCVTEIKKSNKLIILESICIVILLHYILSKSMQCVMLCWNGWCYSFLTWIWFFLSGVRI